MSSVDVATAPAAPSAAASGRWRALLLAAVAACAACGIIYELALLTLSASLDGGGIVATSLIVAGYIAALGVGALLVKPLLAHAAITFIAVEALLGVIGGLSAAALYMVFAFLDGSVGSTWVLAVSTALIGGLVGAEVPLLMTLLQSGRVTGAADAGRTLANLNAADYLGALMGGLVWPFLLLPQLGMIRGAAATGMINLAAAAVVALFLLRRVVSTRQLLLALCALAAALGLLATLLLRSADVETTSRQRLYADPIVAYRHTPYQEIVVTRRGNDTRLYLDGGLQFSTRDEYRYTESLVYPAVGKGARSVLVLGGGDGLVARELLRLPGVSKIVQVELDPAVIDIARTTLRGANGGSLDNPRVAVVTQDAMNWLRGPDVNRFDAIIVDLPDPDTPVLGRLYSAEFYALAARALAPGGLMAVQAGSPFSTPTAYWRTVSTIRAAGYAVTPYHVHVPTFGDWGFALAQRADTAPTPTVPPDAPPLRFLNQQVLQAACVFSGDVAPRPVEPSTLDNPRIVEDMRHGYD
ncbi:polyamine aminopropyltransferase [Mycobacterium intracellulare]|uniref:Polyamine aminopropyltransferase n=1 Tax=Mycobacterium intracellulare TaxID=1767 RepID=A0AAE4RNI9_MYCIT|nr:polyamine aminopropyltransferase [Mycobacterium intracellulare]ASQ87287.1 spermidine synthase [Mycobacterium intracellulare subsp. chimaera]MCA2321940.1 polyamine aminopropyltransferase [Mycobacterium intracellulare]MCA2343850.1 polyamine aminopropyltransferase [Mycobacterium intracellulare]MCF1815434.1 polyamine aminopropyltransferase [Mycobacterium intracellulare subsp. intracellulare]MDS0337339.1 polyamine aminopropyltransferase [Mycobacterium intracellulare]